MIKVEIKKKPHEKSCVKTINRHGFCHQGIFRVNGLQAELNKLQEAFEAGEDPLIPASLSDELDFDINSIAGLLKVWGRSLIHKPSELTQF